jgi:hypothetical protein
MKPAETPLQYRIVVKGRLSDVLGSAFEGMRAEPGDGRTALSGAFTDQAQLHGVIERLRDFGIELVSINPVEEVGH